MAWLVGDSFDFYSAASEASLNTTVWQTATFGVLNAATRFGIGQCLLLGNTSVTVANFQTVAFANSGTIYVNFNFKTVSAHVNGGTTQIGGFMWKDTNAFIQGGFWIRNGGDFVVTSGTVNTTILATSPMLAPSASVWHHCQIKIVVHNTAGSVELRMDGNTSPDWLATGLNTRNGTANFFANVIHFTSTNANDPFIDDFYVFNDQGIQPNTWQGDVFAVQQMPVSDVATAWTRNSGTNNCLAVDDLIHDGDVTYVGTNIVNAIDTYAISQLFTIPAAIIAVALKYTARMDDAGPHAMTAQLISGPTTTSMPNYVTTTNYTPQQVVYPTDPNTGAPWAGASVNDLLLNIKALL